MRYSSFNWKSGIWAANPKRGWIFGPFRGRTLAITWERKALTITLDRKASR